MVPTQPAQTGPSSVLDEEVLISAPPYELNVPGIIPESETPAIQRGTFCFRNGSISHAGHRMKALFTLAWISAVYSAYLQLCMRSLTSVTDDERDGLILLLYHLVVPPVCERFP